MLLGNGHSSNAKAAAGRADFLQATSCENAREPDDMVPLEMPACEVRRNWPESRGPTPGWFADPNTTLMNHPREARHTKRLREDARTKVVHQAPQNQMYKSEMAKAKPSAESSAGLHEQRSHTPQE
eukprot:CAMPEP_0183400282 /NCGR_PEP_ID=MMETSP0370-20130417/12495_1 /TAXON_ID=268820 /ORGANISM="Peridinium aciculiferum, Strain PAER-2" /LENGTH=125 /DNA_ID=CAMNT_0025581567 /DNA_START=57 /DNA_END=434 /DNA_ORIENTATION=-